MQAVAEKTVATSKDFYDKAATFALESAKMATELANTVWGSTKLLNEKVTQYVSANVEAGFAAAHQVTVAKSLPEIGKIQAADLSTRATQHLFEKAQPATKNFKPMP